MSVKILRGTDPVPISTIVLTVYGDPGCISSDTHIGYQIRDQSGRSQNSKGGPLGLLYARFHGLHRPGSGYYQRPQTIGSSFYVQSITDDGVVEMNLIKDMVDSGRLPVFRVETMGGKVVTATGDHEFRTSIDPTYAPLEALSAGSQVWINPGRVRPTTGKRRPPNRAELFVKNHPAERLKIVAEKYRYFRVRLSHAIYEADQNQMLFDQYVDALNSWPKERTDALWHVPVGMEIHHLDEDPTNDVLSNLEMVSKSEHQRRFHAAKNTEHVKLRIEPDTIRRIDAVGVQQCYDIVCSDPLRNFVAGGVAVHNSGKTSTLFTAEAPLLLDFDKGAHRSQFRRDSVSIDKWSDVAEMTEADLADFRTIGVDTVGRCLDVMAAEIMRKDPKTRRGSGQLSLQGFGALKAMFAAWLKHLRSMGKHVVMLGHGVEQRDGDDLIIRPEAQGSSYNEIIKVSDGVGYIHMIGANRTLAFDPTDKYVGKNPAQITPITVPHFDQAPTFLQDVIEQIVSRMGQLSATGTAVKKLVGEWRTKINECVDLGALAAVETTAQMEIDGPALKQILSLAATHRKALAGDVRQVHMGDTEHHQPAEAADEVKCPSGKHKGRGVRSLEPIELDWYAANWANGKTAAQKAWAQSCYDEVERRKGLPAADTGGAA